MVRALPRTPIDPPKFQPEWRFSIFVQYFQFFTVFNICFVICWPYRTSFWQYGTPVASYGSNSPMWDSALSSPRTTPSRTSGSARSSWVAQERGMPRQGFNRDSHPNAAQPTQKHKIITYGRWEGFDKTEVCGKMVGNLLPPVSRNLVTGSIRKLDFHDLGFVGKSHFITEWSQTLPVCHRPREHKLLFLLLTSSSNHPGNM